MTDAFEVLRARFLERCRADLQRLRSGPSNEELAFTIHRLAGAAGSFGFPGIGAIAAQLDATTSRGSPARADIEALLSALEKELHASELTASPTEGEERSSV